MLPKSMKAVRIFEYGDASVLQYVDAPLPEMGEDDVLIKIEATSVNGFDLKYRLGKVKAPPGRDPFPMPFQLGRDAAGEVAAIGSKGDPLQGRGSGGRDGTSSLRSLRELLT